MGSFGTSFRRFTLVKTFPGECVLNFTENQRFAGWLGLG
jgi:hypothetical protein